MPLPKEDAIQDELKYLYERLSTVNNLIRSLEQYEEVRPKPAPVRKQKSA